MAKGRQSERGAAKGSRNVDAVALKVLRESSGLTQDELAGRAQITKSMLGKYERGTSKLTTEDQRRILEGLDYPPRAWTETLSYLARMERWRSRYSGKREEVVDRSAETSSAAWVVRSDGRVDIVVFIEEVRRIWATAGQNVEDTGGELMELLVELLMSLNRSKS